MKIHSCFYIMAVAGTLLHGCNNKYDVEEQRYTWSTNAPLTIPYRTRIQRLEKGNLLRNPSFETGRSFTIDSSRSSYVIDGWQQTGRHVEWVDTRNDSLYQSDEACSGLRAVKIIRETALETDDQGEGIMSEFLKVIPGNYHLTAYIRLENVFPSHARLGKLMNDAVNISLLFFDRNKNPILPRAGYPQINQSVNTSFKSLSFANYNFISKFDWGRVIGKTDHFPFPDGDIPSEAHYVKVFIGLKGSGTLWIDSVSLSYTDHNFTVAERMLPYTDTTAVLQHSLIPTPKEYRRLESLVFYRPGMDQEEMPLIVIPPNAGAQVEHAAAMMQQALQQSMANTLKAETIVPAVRIVHACNDKQVESSLLVISIGKTVLEDRFARYLRFQDIREHAQGYSINSPGDFPNIVLLSSFTDEGLYYAVLSAVQLIDNRQPVFHNARIIDYPDFPERFYHLMLTGNQEETQQQAVLAGELVSYKINGAWYTTRPDAGTGEARSFIRVLSRYLPDEDFFQTLQLSAPVFTVDSTLTYNYLLHSSEQVLSDYLHQSRSTPSSPGGSGVKLLPVSNNQLLDILLYHHILPYFEPGVRPVYTGASFFSFNTDDADIERFTSFAGEPPVFMDNSMLAASPWGQYGGNDPYYPGKIRLYNIFEPYGNEQIRMLFQRTASDIFLINQTVLCETDLIRMATAADFMWNANTYSKDFSLWKVLLSRYGAVPARELIRYADLYGAMLETLLQLKTPGQFARSLKAGQQILAELTRQAELLEKLLGKDHRLVQELTALNTNMEHRLELASKSASSGK